MGIIGRFCHFLVGSAVSMPGSSRFLFETPHAWFVTLSGARTEFPKNPIPRSRPRAAGP